MTNIHTHTTVLLLVWNMYWGYSRLKANEQLFYIGWTFLLLVNQRCYSSTDGKQMEKWHNVL